MNERDYIFYVACVSVLIALDLGFVLFITFFPKIFLTRKFCQTDKYNFQYSIHVNIYYTVPDPITLLPF